MLLPSNQSLQVDRTAPLSSTPAVVTSFAVRDPEPKAGDPAGLHSLTALLWRRKLTIAGVALIGLLTGIAIGLLTKPVYRARTSLQLEGFNDQASSPVSQQLPNATPENYLQNEVKVIESDTLARRIADEADPGPGISEPGLLARVGDWFRFMGVAHPPTPADIDDQRTRRIKKALTVRTSLQSQVIELLYDAPDPDLAARGANAAAAEFINLNREARSQVVQDTTEWLNKQAAELKARLESSNLQLQAFASRSGLVVGDNQSMPEQDRMRQIQEALTRAEADRATKQARYEVANNNPDQLTSDTVASGPLRQYQVDLQGLRRQLADLRTIYTPDNYKVTRVEAQITDTEAAIAKERKAILGQMHDDYTAAASLERMLSTNLTRQLTATEQQTEKQLQFNVLKNDVETNQRLYNSVLEKAKEAGAASSLRMTNVRVIDAALPPSTPYSPNLPLNMAIGLGIGAVGGIGLVLLGARPGKVKQLEELGWTNLPALGVVPTAKGTQALEILGPNSSGGITVKGESESVLLKESFRAVLTSILFSTSFGTGSKVRANRARGRTLTVTSVDMMEGKTTIVTHLGVASAECNRDVLLVDADLRRPSLHERLGLHNRYGLTNLLGSCDPPADSQPLDSLVQPTKIPHLWVLTSGPVDASSPNVLHGADLGALLQRFERQFDLVFIDTPPMSLYSDARILGRMADGVVMVVRANTKSREELRAAYQQLMQDRIHVLGTVLNDWKIDSGQARAYHRYYSHYERSTRS